MSLRVMTSLSAPPRLLLIRRLSGFGGSSYKSNRAVTQRKFSSSPTPTKTKMTAEEVEMALENANESMKAYYSYPPEKVIAAKRAKFNARHMNKQFYLQLGLGVSLLCSFLATPFIGRKIAYDEEFKKKYIPSWYDYTLEKPKSAWTRAELQEQLVQLRTDLHERAIRGEFTPEKLDEKEFGKEA
ncbi:hypothetical protein ACHAWC_000193 [Mediolabrus comicus]